ncbi:hypothetical protein [Zoogloea sp.]
MPRISYVIQPRGNVVLRPQDERYFDAAADADPSADISAVLGMDG